MDSEEIQKGSMRAAYIFQAVNLSVSILTVPVLLHYLDVSGYVLWSVFMVFGAITLQVQNGIQPVAVREIAREYYGASIDGLDKAVRRAKSAYRMLVGFVLGPLAISGIIYFLIFVNPKLDALGLAEWLMYDMVWALNYSFAANSAILLGTVRIARQNNINTVTRTIQFLLTVLLLREGLSVLGICLSFGLGVTLSCVLTARAAAKRLKEVHASMGRKALNAASSGSSQPQSMGKYLLYSLSAYALYNGSLLIVAAAFPKKNVGAYALSIQTFTLMSTLSVVPVQVWLSRLVAAVRRRDLAQMRREFAATVIVANVGFFAGYILLLALGNGLLDVLGSTVHLLATPDLSLTFVAYFVELNVLISVNFLVTAGTYKFVPIYLATSIASLSLAFLSCWLTHNLILSFVVLPFTIQGGICLPMTFQLVSKQLEMKPREFLLEAGAYLKSLL